MTKPLYILLISCAIFVGCTNNKKSVDAINDNKTTSSITDEDIYGFMNYLINKGVLNKDFDIEITPEKSFGYLQETDSILFRLEQKSSASNSSKCNNLDSVVIDSIPFQLNGKTYYSQIKSPQSYTLFPNYPEIFTKQDVESINKQLEINSDFKWNNDKLGFQGSSEYWYQISVPCFSEDKTHVLILIRSLCPGLCGGGDLFLFTKNGKAWKKKVLDSWYH